MAKKYTIGTRGSVLALWQAEHIRARLFEELGVESELKIIKTKGDKILDVPLAKIGGKGLFTKELEVMLLENECDLAVHSLKDVPVEFVAGLGLVAITKREDVRDCFLSDKYESLSDLPHGAKVGTTSLRRTMQLKALRPDLDTQSLRGNVQTRLERLRKGEFDAIILAKAGANRLGLSQSDVAHIEPFDTKSLVPAMGQGALGIECRIDGGGKHADIAEVLKALNHRESALCCEAEREFVRCLEGGCQVPIGVHASLKFDALHITAVLGLPDGSRRIDGKVRAVLSGSDSHLHAAKDLAADFISRGAREILKLAMEFEF